MTDASDAHPPQTLGSLRPQILFEEVFGANLWNLCCLPSVLSNRSESRRENTLNLISPPSTEECFLVFLISCESDSKSYGCDIFTCALVSSVTVPAPHLRTLPQGARVSSKTVFSHLSSHRVAPISTLRTHSTLVAEQVADHFVNPRPAARAHRKAAEDACLFQAATGERTSTCVQVNNFFSFVCGAKASSAVSSVFFSSDAAGNHAESRASAHIYYGDAASFHE